MNFKADIHPQSSVYDLNSISFVLNAARKNLRIHWDDGDFQSNFLGELAVRARKAQIRVTYTCITRTTVQRLLNPCQRYTL